MTNNALIDNLINNIETVILGKKSEIKNLTKGILANGHILIEDMPGVGKTMLVKALCKSLNLKFSRIQFTPDILPTDITGVSIFNPASREFEFKSGPIFSNIILADEINRATPKTQSALLECMEEKQISEGNITYKLKAPFLVLATQNPIEHEGTFPLPEAQLDRFIMKVNIGYPSYDAEVNILKTYRASIPLNSINPICSLDQLLHLQSLVQEVALHDDIYDFIISIISATRNNDFIEVGSSVRGSLALMKLVQAEAFLDGRNYAIPEDVLKNVVPALSHRIKLSTHSVAKGYSSESVLKELLTTIKVPHINSVRR